MELSEQALKRLYKLDESIRRIVNSELHEAGQNGVDTATAYREAISTLTYAITVYGVEYVCLQRGLELDEFVPAGGMRIFDRLTDSVADIIGQESGRRDEFESLQWPPTPKGTA